MMSGQNFDSRAPHETRTPRIRGPCLADRRAAFSRHRLHGDLLRAHPLGRSLAAFRLGLLLKGALGSTFALTETLTRATPLIFTGLAAAVAFRAKLWNIGGEGQFYVGACMATWLGTGMIDLPAWLMIPFLFLSGALAGGSSCWIPTWLKTRLKADEVVTTLLLNFVVLLVVNWLVFGPWKDPMAMGWPQAAPVIDTPCCPCSCPSRACIWASSWPWPARACRGG
jgi:nucleoside ABC transporter membrane protein